jgi:hypothetical protein
MMQRLTITAAALTAFAILAPAALAQSRGQATVTVETSQPTISAQAVRLSVQGGKSQITSFTQLRGDDGPMQLLILLDDSARRGLSLQFKDLGSFIMSMPPTTQVGVAYMQNGAARFVQQFTANHEEAAASLRIPSGVAGGNGSPYFVLTDLMKRWSGEVQSGGVALRPGAIRREVLMLTDGVEAYDSGRFDPNNPYVQQAISDAQRQGVIVYAIYVRDVGTNGLAGAEANNGQNYLVQLTTATGGKTYYNGTFSSPDFRPYFDDLKKQLDSQYQLKFTTAAKSKDSVGLKVKIDGAKATAPARVYLEESAQ